MKTLNRTNANLNQTPSDRILQFGGGNFLRAFVDWMIDELNEKTGFNGGVIVVKPTQGGDYGALRQQDGLFHVVLEGIRKGKTITDRRLVKSINRIIHPYVAFEDFLTTARSESIRFIISNTTEAGIVFNKADRFTDTPQKEFPGKLTRWLYERFRHFEGDPKRGCIFLPCELIEHNGTALQKCILQYAQEWKLETSFSKWVQAHNIFCNTLVDRIVSGFPSGRAADLQKELGYKDELLVAGEYYHSWVIQGPRQVAKELPFSQTNLNVKFVEDLQPYRQIKVRILNGAHTSMVPIGYLAGLESVREAIEHPLIGKYIQELLFEEVIPTLDFPKTELEAFANDVLDRFRNPAIHHRLISIALNSTSKFKIRLLPSLLKYHQKTGKVASRISFALAALIRFYKGDLNGTAIPLNDNAEAIDFFQKIWQTHHPDLKTLCLKVLQNKNLWGQDLSQSGGLHECLTQQLEAIENQGILSSLKRISPISRYND